MPPSPVQIKEKLLKGIDEDNNVVNAQTVSEVISILEKTALTRSDLETTRLGLHINLVRKKTKDQELARRCKKLVKCWQQLVSATPSNHASPAQGYSPVVTKNLPYTASPKLPSHNSSPALSHTKCISPKLHNRLTSPASGLRDGRSSSPAGRLVSPLVRQSEAPNRKGSPAPDRSYGFQPVPAKPASVSPKSGSSCASITKPRSTGANIKSNHVSSRPQTPTNNNHTNSTPNLDSTNRTHAANKKRRRSEESIASDASSIKKSRTMVNGDAKISERTKTPRVKTTVQLIAELRAQKSTSLTASDTITKIVTNQIEKEEDDIHASIVPAAAKPRPRRKNGSLINPPEAPGDLSRTKSDLVHRFLQQSVHQENNSSRDSADLSDDHIDILNIDPVDTPKPAIDMSVDPYSLLPPIDYDSITWSDNDEDVGGGPIRRNPITGEYPEGHDMSSNDDCCNAQQLDRILNEEWPGVNGTSQISQSTFHDWTETVVESNNHEQDKYDIYVLPYVDI